MGFTPLCGRRKFPLRRIDGFLSLLVGYQHAV